MSDIIQIVILTIACERTTEIIVDSKLFEPLRGYIKRWVYNINVPPQGDSIQDIKVGIDYLVNCGYCASVWVGIIMASFAPTYFTNKVANFIIMAMLIHGLSNLYHVMYELLKRGRVKTYDIQLRNMDEEKE